MLALCFACDITDCCCFDQIPNKARGTKLISVSVLQQDNHKEVHKDGQKKETTLLIKKNIVEN